MLVKIEQLLGRVPHGEDLAGRLAGQLTQLQESYDELTITTIKMDLRMAQERISSLKAGLKTWMDHLERISRLSGQYEELVGEVQTTVGKHEGLVEGELPTNCYVVKEEMRKCQVGIMNVSVCAFLDLA